MYIIISCTIMMVLHNQWQIPLKTIVLTAQRNFYETRRNILPTYSLYQCKGHMIYLQILELFLALLVSVALLWSKGLWRLCCHQNICHNKNLCGFAISSEIWQPATTLRAIYPEKFGFIFKPEDNALNLTALLMVCESLSNHAMESTP